MISYIQQNSTLKMENYLLFSLSYKHVCKINNGTEKNGNGTKTYSSKISFSVIISLLSRTGVYTYLGINILGPS